MIIAIRVIVVSKIMKKTAKWDAGKLGGDVDHRHKNHL